MNTKRWKVWNPEASTEDDAKVFERSEASWAARTAQEIDDANTAKWAKKIYVDQELEDFLRLAEESRHGLLASSSAVVYRRTFGRPPPVPGSADSPLVVAEYQIL